MQKTSNDVDAAGGDRTRRIQDANSRPVLDRTSLLFQPTRLDVLVHLRALEELAGADPMAANGTVDWVGASDALAADDVEPTVGELAAELLAAETLDHAVVFGAGGRLVAGATTAAACLYGEVPLLREDTGIRAIDRSQHRLVDRGFTEGELRGAIDTWLQRDPRAALVFIDHEARCAEAALAEIERRYEVFYAEFDHLSDGDAAAIGLESNGSMHVLSVRVNPRTIAAVLARHRDAVAGSFTGAAAVAAARKVFDGAREASSSPSHARALRSRRRVARRARVITGLRALKS